MWVIEGASERLIHFIYKDPQLNVVAQWKEIPVVQSLLEERVHSAYCNFWPPAATGQTDMSADLLWDQYNLDSGRNPEGIWKKLDSTGFNPWTDCPRSTANKTRKSASSGNDRASINLDCVEVENQCCDVKEHRQMRPHLHWLAVQKHHRQYAFHITKKKWNEERGNCIPDWQGKARKTTLEPCNMCVPVEIEK